jgi:glycosyltransferase involved in cell wall biosynthesis
LPAIPKRQVQSLLSLFDVCYIGLQNKELFKYGISPNKIFDYMYAAKPILLAVNSPNNPVSLAQCGICINDITPENIAKAILDFYQMPENQRKEIGSRGKEYVIKHHTFEALAKKYDELIKSIIPNKY